MKKYETNKTLIARIGHDEIPDDVIDRIQGYQSFDDTDNARGDEIYCVERINQILQNPEDDTNETTKGRLEDLYEQIKDCNFLWIGKWY